MNICQLLMEAKINNYCLLNKTYPKNGVGHFNLPKRTIDSQRSGQNIFILLEQQKDFYFLPLPQMSH